MKSASALCADLITDLAELEELSPEWTELWNRCPGATPFQRPEWVLSWTQAFRPSVLRVIAVRQDTKLVGLAPLFLYRSGTERILAPLAASVSDYLDWLVDPADSAAILDCVFAGLNSLGQSWDRLDMTDLPGTSALLKGALDDWSWERGVETACPVLRLAPAVKSVEEMLSAKQRHNLRTARHRIERAGQGRIELATRDTLAEFLAALMRLHAMRWNRCGTPGMLAGKLVQEFHRMATQGLLERNVLRLYGLRFQNELIATLYALAEREVVYCYLQGFEPAYGKFSPGAQIVAAVIDDALREGKKEVDFLRGREAYKYSWGARDQETYRLCLRKRAGIQLPAPRVSAA